MRWHVSRWDAVLSCSINILPCATYRPQAPNCCQVRTDQWVPAARPLSRVVPLVALDLAADRGDESAEEFGWVQSAGPRPGYAFDGVYSALPGLDLRDIASWQLETSGELPLRQPCLPPGLSEDCQ